MSMNNLTKRNLFELKNDYAQLVEAQSPEPPEFENDAKLEPAGEQANASSAVVVDLPPSGRHVKEIEDRARRSQGPNRKWSQTSSQVSTSFISSSGSQSHESTSGAQTSNRATCLNKTISQSMLELDQSARLDKFEVSWRNLSFSHQPGFVARFSKKPTHVLNDISGSIVSNQLVAVIGPSGCGKTTLLQFLAGSNPNHRDKLRIVGLDEPKVAFIGQGDCLLPGLTARETLIYASRLQNSQRGFNHYEHTKPILDELGLSDCSDRSVTKLSGGQAKRVTIAQELLYPTNLLILDEVTSGLDASTSYSIVKLLKQLVSNKSYPMSIVMSIHQPSAKLFAVFDQVYVMSEGCCLYDGSCSVDVINSYLGRFNLECPKFHNMADFLIEIASNDINADAFVKERMVQFQRKQSSMQDQANDRITSELYTSSGTMEERDAKFILDDRSQNVSMLMNNNLYEAILRARNRRERPIFKHIWVHLCRSLLRIRRSYILTYLQLVTYIVLGLQLATFYGPSIGSLSGCPRLPMSFMAFTLSNETDDSSVLEMRRIQENMNFLLVAIMTATFAALEITVITFPLEAKTVNREWRNGWYRVSSYFMGRSLADLPFQLSFVVVFCVVIYTLTDQIGFMTWRFFVFVAIIIMTALVAQTVGFIFGAMFMDNLPAAVFIAPLCIFPALLFSGFFSRVSQVPLLYKPMTYLSHFRYAFDALLVTLYGYERCDCDQAVLDSYHESRNNQTGAIKNMFKTLFGMTDCVVGANPEENSIEDLHTSGLPNSVINSTTTNSPRISSITTSSYVEDAIVEGLFQQMKNSTEPSPHEGDAMDRIAFRFSNRITSMLNSQSNFGHQAPTQCKDFNPYLMTEFDLHNEDLMFGLLMLLVFVILSRLLCNAILAFTISTRSA